MRTREALPDFDELATALRITTERLAREIAGPLQFAPDWSPFEWDVARAVAVMQGISVVLAHSLRWQGPQGWQDFLARQRGENLPRHAKIGDVLEKIDAAARRHAIAVVALKGAALRKLGVWRVPCERPMGDVDLLVRPHDMDAVSHALDEVGYGRSHAQRRHVAFRPRDTASASASGGVLGESVLNPVPIEVHTRISEELPASHVDITARLWPAETCFGINPYASRAALLRHLLLHCAGNMRAHTLRLVQLRDIEQFSTRMTGGDWTELLEGGDPWWMYPPLKLTADYFPACIPSTVLETARCQCPRLLRLAANRLDLTTVSWSNLRINAFPGIEWSRSPLEAMRFAKSRIAPTREAIGELGMALQSLPGLRTIPWYGQRHATRIVRWLLGRPPRVQTLRSVLDALDGRTAGGGAR